MKYVLCYGDSNTYGCAPEVWTRFDFPERWPGVMQNTLGQEYHIYENALNGRTTVFEDPIEEGRCGKAGFDVTLMSNAPLDLVIISLGVNDTKDRFDQSPWDIAWGMDLLIQYVKRSGCGRGDRPPEVLVVSPVLLNDGWGKSLHYTVFSDESIRKCARLAETYRFIAQRAGCHFMDAAEFATATGDGVHISREDHAALGRALADKVRDIIG